MLLELLVHAQLLDLGFLPRVLLVKLLVKLFFDKTFAFLVTEDGLFLFLVMEKSVELLNCSPFVILIKL